MKKLLTTFIVTLSLFGIAFGQGITVWHTFTDQRIDWLDQQVASFTAAFGVPVEVVKIDFGEAQQKMLLGAPQGEAADLLIGVPHDRIGELAVGGVAADMTSFATAPYLADLNDQARLAFTLGGKLFALPMYIEGPALIVNTDLVPEIPSTYEAMIAAAQELTTSDTFGFMYDINNFYFAYNWLHSMGGYVFSRDARGDLNPADVGLANEGAIKGAQAIKALRFDYNLIPDGTDYNVANGLFTDGTLAMIYNGPWAIAGYRDAGLNVAVVPMPAMADGTPFNGFMGTQGIVLNPFAKNRVDSANFAKWLTRGDAQLDLARFTGTIPVSKAALAQVQDDPVIAGFGAALANAEPMPNIPEMGSVWGPMGNALSVITASADSDVAATLEQAVKEIKGE